MASHARLPKIAVVIPCYRVKLFICDVLKDVGDEVTRIYVVDDACPDGTGKHVLEHVQDPRVEVIFHPENLGVGGAMVTGYQKALTDDMEIVVKIDGDGQMNPKLLQNFVAPIVNKQADYTKGNRFHSIYKLNSMPMTRLIGNAILSFVTKLSSGYWKTFDPTNGYTAVHRNALEAMDLGKLSKRYFFESDMLIHLNGVRAVIADVSMEAVYGDESSNLRIRQILFEFLGKHIWATIRRIIYMYYLRDFNIASINLAFGVPLIFFGVFWGLLNWISSIETNEIASAGTVMLSALPIIIGFQMLFQFISYDVGNQPTETLQSQNRLE